MKVPIQGQCSCVWIARQITGRPPPPVFDMNCICIEAPIAGPRASNTALWQQFMEIKYFAGQCRMVSWPVKSLLVLEKPGVLTAGFWVVQYCLMKLECYHVMGNIEVKFIISSFWFYRVCVVLFFMVMTLRRSQYFHWVLGVKLMKRVVIFYVHSRRNYKITEVYRSWRHLVMFYSLLKVAIGISWNQLRPAYKIHLFNPFISLQPMQLSIHLSYHIQTVAIQ